MAIKFPNLPNDPEDFRATLIEHLEELRTRLFRVLIFLAIGWIIGWFIEPSLYSFLNSMITNAVRKALPAGVGYHNIFLNATEPFMLMIQLSFVIGMILSFPLILIQLWGFIAPGLKSNERKPVERIAPISAFLFIMGVSFCWIILPKAVTWFAGYLVDFPGTSLYQHAGLMVFFCLKLLLAFGVGFQLPLAIWLFGAIGLYESATLAKYWREGAFGIFVIAAIVTPSNDWFSMMMMAIPLTLLFLISIWALRITENRKKRRKAKEEANIIS